MPIWAAWLVKRLGHFIVYFILAALIIWAIYGAYIKPIINPNPTTTQTGGVSYNIKIGFGGCARLPVVQEKNVLPSLR